MYGNDPFAPLSDACDVIERGYDPKHATEMLDLLAAAPEAVVLFARLMTGLGNLSVDRVKLHPAVGAALRELGSYVAKAEGPVRDVGDAIRRSHAEEIERIERRDARDAAWDVDTDRNIA